MQQAEWIAEIDGSAQPNPGRGGWGVYLEGPGIKKELHGSLSYTTNNQAEYRALLEAVRLAKSLDVRKLLVRTDSQLVYNQFNGYWQIRDRKIEKTLQQIKKEAEEAGLQIKVVWVKRKKNARADGLSKRWLERG